MGCVFDVFAGGLGLLSGHLFEPVRGPEVAGVEWRGAAGGGWPLVDAARRLGSPEGHQTGESHAKRAGGCRSRRPMVFCGKKPTILKQQYDCS